MVPESGHQGTTLTLWDLIRFNTNQVPRVKTSDIIRHVRQHSQKSHGKHRNRRAAAPDQSEREKKNDKGEIREVDDELGELTVDNKLNVFTYRITIFIYCHFLTIDHNINIWKIMISEEYLGGSSRLFRDEL